MKRSPLTLTIAFLLIVIFGLMLFVFQVRKSEVAIVTLFGKLEQNRVKTAPGAYLKWPWPIEQVRTLDQRVHTLDDLDKLEPVQLPDHNIILVQTYTGWRIADPFKFFPNIEDGSVSKAESILATIIRSAKLTVAGRHDFSDFLSADPTQMKLPQIENEILEKVRTDLGTNYGIEVKFVQLTSIVLPEGNTESVFTRMKGERTKVISQIQAQAVVDSTNIAAAADYEAGKILAQANANALLIQGEGSAQMVQSLSVMQQNPELAKLIMNLEMMEGASGDKTTWILDSTMPGFELLKSAHASTGVASPTK
jgi:modulator of FtsH protease HflC